MPRRSLQSEIIEFIQSYILEQNLQPGDRLPSLANLAEMVNVSLPSMREAIKMLEGQNILQTKNGKGIFFLNGIPSTISTQIQFTKEKESILELLEARRVLEHEIISLVIQRATDAELDEIASVLFLLMDKYNKGEQQSEIDRKFHSLYYKYCHNRVMQQLMISIGGLLEKLWSSPLGLSSPFTSTIPLHQELFEATRERNIKTAQMINDRIIRMDIDEVRAAISRQ